MQNSQKFKTLIRCSIIGTSILVTVFIAGFLVRHANALLQIFRSNNPASEMEKFIAGLGVWGPAALVLLQTVQIALAFLPGEPIELAAGILYGGIGGSLLCLSGSFLGSAAVYFAVSRLGQNLIEAFHNRQSIEKFRRLRAFREEKSAETLTFFLFLIPAVPKDFLTFMAPFTPMKPLRFLLISTLGRAPGMFITTYAGRSILAGDYRLALILYGVLAAGAAASWIFTRHMTTKQ